MFNSYNLLFTPGFLDILSQNKTFTSSQLYQDALNNCSNISACISDSILTGDVNFGVVSKNTLIEQIKANDLSSKINKFNYLCKIHIK